jgi:hypothetical protein
MNKQQIMTLSTAIRLPSTGGRLGALPHAVEQPAAALLDARRNLLGRDLHFFRVHNLGRRVRLFPSGKLPLGLEERAPVRVLDVWVVDERSVRRMRGE